MTESETEADRNAHDARAELASAAAYRSLSRTALRSLVALLKAWRLIAPLPR